MKQKTKMKQTLLPHTVQSSSSPSPSPSITFLPSSSSPSSFSSSSSSSFSSYSSRIPAVFRSTPIIALFLVFAIVQIFVSISIPLTHLPSILHSSTFSPSFSSSYFYLKSSLPNRQIVFPNSSIPSFSSQSYRIHSNDSESQKRASFLFTHTASLLSNFSVSFSDSAISLSPNSQLDLSYDTYIPIPTPPSISSLSAKPSSKHLNLSLTTSTHRTQQIELANRVQLLLKSLNRPLTHNPPTTKPFILFRAIGNDLPPRHAKGQVMTNVRFILDNEQSLPDLDVRWYVNRIVDEEAFISIIQLLVERNQTFVIDPFNVETYANIDFKVHGFGETDILRDPIFHPFSNATKNARRLVWDDVFAPKNHYIIHNNQARNAMLKLGFAAGATYVMPWDGNCFLTKIAWNNITNGIDRVLKRNNLSPISSSTASSSKSIARLSRSSFSSVGRGFGSSISTRYFYVPMQRVTDNNNLLSDDYKPETIDEEPQLIFHKAAVERFNESLRYGCAPKVALLSRLRIPGVWDVPSNATHDCVASKKREPSKDIGPNQIVQAVGWTARLFSGMMHLEVEGARRGSSRSNGVEIIAARASRMVANKLFQYMNNSCLFYDMKQILTLSTAYKNNHNDQTKEKISNVNARFWKNIKYLIFSANNELINSRKDVQVLKLNNSLNYYFEHHQHQHQQSNDNTNINNDNSSYNTLGHLTFYNRNTSLSSLTGKQLLQITQFLNFIDESQLPPLNYTKLFTDVAQDSVIHALAATITGNETYAMRSIKLIRAAVGADIPRTNSPSLPGSGSGIRSSSMLGESADFKSEEESVFVGPMPTIDGGMGTCSLLEAAKLLSFLNFANSNQKVLDEDTSSAVYAWAKSRSDFLQQGAVGQLGYFGRAVDGVLFEVQMACVSAYINDFVGVLRATALARGRLLTAFTGDLGVSATSIATGAGELMDRSLGEENMKAKDQLQLNNNGNETNAHYRTVEEEALIELTSKPLSKTVIWEDEDGGAKAMLAFMSLGLIAERFGVDIWLFGAKSVHGGVCALREALRLFVEDVLSGDSDDSLTTKVTAVRRDVARVITCVTEHRLAEMNVSLWGNQTLNLKPAVDQDCIEEAPSIIDSSLPFIPFWNLAFHSTSMLNIIREDLKGKSICTASFTLTQSSQNFQSTSPTSPATNMNSTSSSLSSPSSPSSSSSSPPSSSTSLSSDTPSASSAYTPRSSRQNSSQSSSSSTSTSSSRLSQLETINQR